MAVAVLAVRRGSVAESHREEHARRDPVPQEHQHAEEFGGGHAAGGSSTESWVSTRLGAVREYVTPL